MVRNNLFSVLLLTAGVMLLASAPSLARNRITNPEFDSNSAGVTEPTGYRVHPQPPNPPPTGYPWIVYNECKPGGQIILRMMPNMTNRMFGAAIAGSDFPELRSFYLYQTYTVNDVKDPFPPYTYYASAMVLTYSQSEDPASCKVRVGVGKNLNPTGVAQYDPLDPAIQWGPYVSTQGYPWARADAPPVTADAIGDKITVFINFELPTTDTGKYNCALVDSVWLNTYPFPKLCNFGLTPINADCTDWRVEWDTQEPGGTQVYYRRFKRSPKMFGPDTWTYGDAGTLVRLGIDPYAGTDPASPNIKWGPWTPVPDTQWVETRSAFNQIVSGPNFTVFIEAKNLRGEDYAVWIDDVVAWDEDRNINLGLVNGNFESGFVNDPDAAHQRPAGWTKYVVYGNPACVGDSTVFRSSSSSWKLSGSNWTMGIYQVASGAAGYKVAAAAMIRGTCPNDKTHHVQDLIGLTADPDWDGWEFEWKTNEVWHEQITGQMPGVIYPGPEIKTVRITSGPTVDDYTATITWETDVPSTTEVRFNAKGAGDLQAGTFIYRDETLVTHHVARLNDWSKWNIGSVAPEFNIVAGDTVWWQVRSRVPDPNNPAADLYRYGYSKWTGVKDESTSKFVYGGGPVWTGTVGGLRQQPNGTVVNWTDKIVTGWFMPPPLFPTFCYVEEEDRSSGIRVSCDSVLFPGDRVWVTGVLQTIDGEKQIAAGNAVFSESGTPLAPVGMTNRVIAAKPTGGAEAQGMLVTAWGTVTWAGYDAVGNPCFYIDDGSGCADGAGLGTGIRVYSDAYVSPPQYCVVRRGCVGTVKDGDLILPVLRVMDSSDVEIIP